MTDTNPRLRVEVFSFWKFLKDKLWMWPYQTHADETLHLTFSCCLVLNSSSSDSIAVLKPSDQKQLLEKRATSVYLHRSQPIKWRTPWQELKAEACTRNRIGTLITSSLSDLMTSLGSASFLSQMTITCLRLIPLRVFWALLYQLVMKSIPTDRPNWLRQCFN